MIILSISVPQRTHLSLGEFFIIIQRKFAKWGNEMVKDKRNIPILDPWKVQFVQKTDEGKGYE